MQSSWRRITGAAVAASVALIVPVPVTALAAAATAAVPVGLSINEVESSGGEPGDWVELVNTGSVVVDLSGFMVRDNNDSRAFVIPAGTTVAPGDFHVVDVESAFGLGGEDAARLFTPDEVLVDSYSWTEHAVTTYARCPSGTGPFVTSAAPTRGAQNDCSAPPPTIRINEVESSGGTPGDWVELVNTGAEVVDLSGFVVQDDNDTHAFEIPAGTTVEPGGFYVADVDPVFGLGGADSARLFTPAGVLIDSYSWTSHAATTYARCPSGTGPFETSAAPTRGTENDCTPEVAAEPWPGGSAVTIVDDVDVFGTNLSGLAYEPSGTAQPGVLWAVRNGPSTLFRLVWDGARWTPDTDNGWVAGKQLVYPDGTGEPDAEGVTLVNDDARNGIYVAAERNNLDRDTSRPAVLRFDVSSPGTTLEATHDWNLTADLPVLGANLGAEGIAHVPDSVLVAKGFLDERTGAAYDPNSYPGHGDGLFFVGIEQDGAVYAYALEQDTGAFTQVATFASGFSGVMDLEFERETGLLWAVCDNVCNGRTATLDVVQGVFAVTETYERPADLPNLNNEGFAIAPQRECVAGLKPVFWSDDDNTGDHTLRSGTRSCTVLSVPEGPAPGLTAAPSASASPTVAPQAVDRVERVSGEDRVDTALALSQRGFGSFDEVPSAARARAQAVVLTRSDVFADGLAGTPLAADRTAPLLLTGTATLDERVTAELQRVLAPGGAVFLLGGEQALAPSVETAARALGFEVTRLAGADRYATAVAIARDGLGSPQSVLLATGLVFPDAMASGPAAAQIGGAVLLTAGEDLPAATAAYLASLTDPQVWAVGGPASRAVPSATPLVGATRVSTALRVAGEFFTAPVVAGLATGLSFPDSLAGGAQLGRLGGPMLLTDPTDLSPDVAEWLGLHRGTLEQLLVLGGMDALSGAVSQAARNSMV